MALKKANLPEIEHKEGHLVLLLLFKHIDANICQHLCGVKYFEQWRFCLLQNYNCLRLDNLIIFSGSKIEVCVFLILSDIHKNLGAEWQGFALSPIAPKS